MAQPHPTFAAVPSGLSSNLGGRVECTISPLIPMRVVVIMLPDGEVSVWQRADDATTTASPTTNGVVPNQLLGQLDPKGLDVGKRT